MDQIFIEITGGSSGIGLQIAIQSAKLGASVTIIARSKARLEAAKEIIMSVCSSSSQKVLTFSVDVSKDCTSLKTIITKAEEISGPITLLVNCAGTAIAKRFEDTSPEEFTDILNLNYLGSIKVTQAVLPSMKRQKYGRIVFVSSLAGLIGLYGYTAYSGSKFAILGLAEALKMEVKTYNISITVSFPPDTNTPGFAEENKTKPLETHQMSESGGLYSPEDVAAKTLQDAMNKQFVSSVGLGGWLLCTLCSGCTPVDSVFQLFAQVLLMGVFRIVIFILHIQYDHIIKKCFAERMAQKITSDKVDERKDNES